MSIYVDMAGLAELLGISRQYVRYLVDTDKIPRVNTKNWTRERILFTQEQVDEITKKYGVKKSKGVNI